MRALRIVLAAAVVLATVVGACGCGGGLTKDDAHSTVSRFFTELTDGDTDGAIALMYPGLEVQSASFKNYILEVEREAGILFTDGRSNMRVGISEDLGDGDYRVGGEVNIGEVRVEFEAVVRKDGGGVGVFAIMIAGIRF